MTAGEEVGGRVLSPVWVREKLFLDGIPNSSSISYLELSLALPSWLAGGREEQQGREGHMKEMK